MPIKPQRESAPLLLAQAKKHMDDRASTYDKPEGERSMAQTVAVFNLFHGTSLTEAQGWHFQQILKDVRLFTRDGYHADSAEDCIAYAALKAEAKSDESIPVATDADQAKLLGLTVHDGKVDGGSGLAPGLRMGDRVIVFLRNGQSDEDAAAVFDWGWRGDAGGEATEIVSYKLLNGERA